MSKELLRTFYGRLSGASFRRDAVERLIHIEDKINHLMNGEGGISEHSHEQGMKDSIERLIHIEDKINHLMSIDGLGSRDQAEQTVRDAYVNFSGNSAQGYGHITYAQCGEDLVVCNIFTRLGLQPSYLDIGAHHPLEISNTALLYLRGSRGINIEANPVLFQEFMHLRPEDINLNLGIGPQEEVLNFYMIDDRSGRNSFNKNAVEDFVKSDPRFSIQKIMPIQIAKIDHVIEKYSKGIYPDFLSIDIEGNDYDVLQGADFSRNSPLVICAEGGDPIIGAESGSGDSTNRIVKLLQERDYTLCFRTWGNFIFVRNDALKKIS